MYQAIARFTCGVVLLLSISGCVAKPDQKLTKAVFEGNHGVARVYLAERLTPSKSDRNYMLDRMKLGMCTIADGYPGAAEATFHEVFEKLKTQGINADKTVTSVVVNEDLKFWKGEPFEQAMALCYIGIVAMEQDDWGNARAATESSMFQLRDFGKDDKGQKLDAVALATKAAESDKDKSGEGDALLENGYTTVKSNFTLSYLLNGIANQQVGRMDEAAQRYGEAVEINPDLSETVAQLKAGSFNTLLIVDYGQGPQKIGTGPDNALAKFVPLTPSDGAKLLVKAGGKETSVPQTLDLNGIATDLMWNNLEDIRVAKSYIGTILVGAGAGTAASALSSGSSDAAIAGLAMIAVGAIAKAGAHADTRYCEIVPQRVYVVPVTLTGDSDSIELSIEDKGTRLVLAGLSPPPAGKLNVRYIRMPMLDTPPAWAVSGGVVYANDHAPTAGQIQLPYILGGDCACKPTEQALARYQKAGFLKELTLSDLLTLYTAEGIEIEPVADKLPGLHVLEGGNSLVAPRAGTVGYARLFGARHPDYLPKSKEVQAVSAQIKVQLAPRSEKVAAK